MSTGYDRPGVLVVDLQALARNFARLREYAAPATCGAVVKADAYGLGMNAVASKLAREGCQHFFVATVEEGERLRTVLSEPSIFVFEGLGSRAAPALAESRLTPVLNTVDEVERWLPLGLPAALHIDTGMTRLGLDAHDVATLKERAAFARLEIACAVTHFACADERDHPLTEKQLARFEELSAQLPGAPTSIGNSAAVFLGARYCGDLARPGIALYGGNPFSERKSPVEPVASLLGRVLQIRELHEAASVGYGATYEARKGMRIATVGVGYADGYPRAMGNRGEVSFKGKRLPVVGRVSMDLLTIDVSSVGATDIGVGDYVELFGTEVPVDEVALACDTIDYEILTGLGDRLERVYID